MSQQPPCDPTVLLNQSNASGGSTDATVAGGSSACIESAQSAAGPELAALPAVQLREAQGDSPTPVVRTTAAGAAAFERDPSGRLQFQGEIARGGMGAVLKGHDRWLGRDIAIKVLLQEHQDKPDFAQRFIEEAQIAAQLQHPGIAPVYEVGQFSDQRPYFTMKLVKGKTLAALLGDRKSPADDRTKFIGIFTQLCQTLAYAHARGVIHRDLKPSNVMVGAFGEVQVMDWGLAKVLREGGVADEKRAQQRADVSVIRTQRSLSPASHDSSSYTQVGSMLGTPSYLAPEQARGDLELIDERADVFGLGAILCEILTGQPPYTGRGAEATRKAQTGNLAEALEKLEASVADPELINIAKCCLAVEPWDRPRDAGAVSKQLGTFQESVDQRFRDVELAHAAQSARAEEALHTAAEAKAKARAERRTRQVSLALGACLLLAAGLGAASWRRMELDEIRRTSALQARVNAALQEAMRQRGQAQGAAAGERVPWAAALTAANQADALLEPGVDPALRQRVQELLAEVSAGAARAESESRAAARDERLLDQLVEIRTAKEDDSDGTLTDAAYAGAFREADLDVESLSAEELAGRLSPRPHSVTLQVAAYLDDWAHTRRQQRADEEGAKRLTLAAQAIDPDPWRGQLREAMAATGDDKLAMLQELAKSAQDDNLGPISLSLLGRALSSERDLARAEKVLRFAQQRHPADLWVNYDLAATLTELGRRTESIRYLTAARALSPDVAHALAHALYESGQQDEGISVFQELIRLRPNNGRHLACLAGSLRARGRIGEAEAAVEAAIAALQEQIERTPQMAMLHKSLGIAFGVMQETDEQVRAYRRAQELNPRDTASRSNLRRALRTKVQSLQSGGQFDEAVALQRQIVALDPKDPYGHEDLFNLIRPRGMTDDAIAEYRKMLETDPKQPTAVLGLAMFLAQTSSSNREEAIAALGRAAELEPKLAWVQERLGFVLRDAGRLDDAIAACRRSIELSPRHPYYQTNLARLLSQKGNAEQAVAASLKAIGMEPSNADLHHIHSTLLSTHGRWDEAVTAARKAVELNSRSATYYNTLGAALRTTRRFEEAASAYRKACELAPTVASNHYNHGLALSDASQLSEAAIAFRTAVELNPKSADYQYRLGQALATSQPADAAAAFRATIEIDPTHLFAHDALANALKTLGTVDQIVFEYQRALELNPEQTLPRYGLPLALRAAGRTEEAIAAFRQALEINPKSATLHNYLGYTLRSLNRNDEAVEAHRAAAELAPRNSLYRRNLGVVLGAMDRNEEAIAEFRQATVLDPRYAAGFNSLGVTLTLVGRHDEAIPACQKAVELGPRVSEYHYSLGEAYDGTGRLHEAIATHRQALSLNPIHFGSNHALARLLSKQDRYWEAAAHYEKAIAARPGEVNRYDAAACAARAAAQSNAPLSEAQRVHWRTQALAWIRAEATELAKRIADDTVRGPQAAETMAKLLHDPSFAAVRDSDALALLPTDEQIRWRDFWAGISVAARPASSIE